MFKLGNQKEGLFNKSLLPLPQKNQQDHNEPSGWPWFHLERDIRIYQVYLPETQFSTQKCGGNWSGD